MAIESQVDRVKRDIETMCPDYLKTYIISKVQEFERLRSQYETQLGWANIEMTRMGQELDKRTLQAAKAGYVNRDQEWLNALQAFPELHVAMLDGLINIPETLRMLKERFGPKDSMAVGE